MQGSLQHIFGQITVGCSPVWGLGEVLKLPTVKKNIILPNTAHSLRLGQVPWNNL